MKHRLLLPPLRDEELSPFPIRVESDRQNESQVSDNWPVYGLPGAKPRQPGDGRKTGSAAGGFPAAATLTLLVSDDDYLRSLIRSFLEHAGFAVVSCGAVTRAAVVFRGEPAIGLLILDAHEMDEPAIDPALDFTRQRAGLPVLVLLAPGGGAAKLDSIARRGWMFLGKPFLVSDLLGLVSRAFELRPFTSRP